MTAKEILDEIKPLGSESYKRVLMNNHGVKEPCFGVKISELKKIQKRDRATGQKTPVTGLTSELKRDEIQRVARSSTTYPRKWISRETTVIRVPERVAEDLLRIARRLDESRSYQFREDSNTLTLEVVTTKRVTYASDKPVDVSSVPQRSPFRYENRQKHCESEASTEN